MPRSFLVKKVKLDTFSSADLDSSYGRARSDLGVRLHDKGTSWAEAGVRGPGLCWNGWVARVWVWRRRVGEIDEGTRAGRRLRLKLGLWRGWGKRIVEAGQISAKAGQRVWMQERRWGRGVRNKRH